MTASAVRSTGMERADKRFEMLARDMGLVAEQHGYDRLTAVRRGDFEKVLFEFFHGSRGAAGELEKRLNGTAEPLVKADGKLDAYECLAVAHELRRLRGAEAAIVLVLDEHNNVHAAAACDPDSQGDILQTVVMAALDGVRNDPAERTTELDFIVEPAADRGQRS